MNMKTLFVPEMMDKNSPENSMQYLSEVTKNPQIVEFATAAQMNVQMDLTNFARVYKPELFNYIQDTVAPRVKVQTESGRYTAFGQEGYDIDTSDYLADDASPNTILWAAEKVSFQIDPRGLQTFVSDRVMDQRGPGNAATIATKLLKQQLTLRQEVRVRNLAEATSQSVTPGTNWDTSSAIWTDISGAQAVMQGALGVRANVIAIGDHILDSMLANTNMKGDIAAAAAMLDGRKFLGLMSGPDLPGVTTMAGMTIVSPNSFYRSSNPGLARVNTRVWGNSVYLFHIDGGSETLTWAIQFEYLPETVVRWRDESRGIGGWWYKMFYQRVVKEITPEAVYKLIDVV